MNSISYRLSQIDKTKDEIARLKNQQKTIGYKMLKDILAEYGPDDVLSEKVRNNKLLSFLLRRGYLD